MEGCPRSSMLSIDLKDSIPVEFTDSLKKYIADHYQEDPENYKHECSQYEQLRAACLHPNHDHSGCSTLRRYFAQLQYLQSRFPMVDGGVAAIQFTWTDLYSEESIALADVRFEQAAILHNLGALHSQLGAQEDRTAEEGMKVACTHFQAAAGVFEHLKNTVMVPLASMKLPWVSEDHFAVPFFDLASCVLQLYINILLGQAQECLLEKSILDGRKDSLIARISMQVYDYYQQALGILESLGSSYLGSKKSKMWTKAIKIKASHFICVSYVHMSNHAHENQQFGEKVTYLKAANEKLTEAQKLSKGQPERTLELLQFMADVVGNKLEGAAKDNDFIYHEVVPELSALPAIKGASLVKPIPFQACDPSVSGPDIFQRLIPVEAHSDASIYSEEKAKLLRRYSASIEVKNKQLAQSLANLHIDDLLQPVETDSLPASLKQLNTEAQRKQGGLLSQAEEKIAESTTQSEEIETILRNISSMLEEDVRKEQLAKVPQGDAAKERDDIKSEYDKCQDALNKADHTYSELVRVYTAHKQNLELIAGPEEQLIAALPSLNIIDSPVDDGAVQRLRDLIAKVEEMKEQRKTLEENLRSKLNEDDITGLLVTREGNKMAFFDEQLRKHDTACSLIQANLDAQDKILGALTEANAKYAKTRQAVKENSQRREEVIKALIVSYNTFCELQEKLSKGVDFYKQLSSTVKKIEEKCKNFFDNHSKELDKLIEKEKAPQPKPPSRPLTAKPDHLVRPPTQMPSTLPGQTELPPGSMYQHVIPGSNTSMPPGSIPHQSRPGQTVPTSFPANPIPQGIPSSVPFSTPHIPANTAPRMSYPRPGHQGQVPQHGQFPRQSFPGPGSPSQTTPHFPSPNKHLPDVSTSIPQVRPDQVPSSQPDILGGPPPGQQTIRPQLPAQHPPGGPPDLISQVRPPFSSQNSIPFQHGHPMSFQRPASPQSPMGQQLLPPRYQTASSLPTHVQPLPTSSSAQPRQPFQPSTSVPSSIHQGFPEQRGPPTQQIRPQQPTGGPPSRPEHQAGQQQKQQTRPQLLIHPQFRPETSQQQQFRPQQQMQGPQFRAEHPPGQQHIRPQQPMQSQFRPELQSGQQQQFRPQSPMQPQFRPGQQPPQSFQPGQLGQPPHFQPRLPFNQPFRPDQFHQPSPERPPQPQFRQDSPSQQPLRPEIPSNQQQRPQQPSWMQLRPGQQPLQPQQQFRPNSPSQHPQQPTQQAFPPFQQQPLRPPLTPQQPSNQPLRPQHQIGPAKSPQLHTYRPQQQQQISQFQRPPTSFQQPVHPKRLDQSLPQPLLPEQLNNQQKRSEEKRDQPSQQPFRPDQSSKQPFRPDQSSKQPFRPDQSSQQPFRTDQSSQQPFPADQSSQQPFRPDQSSQQPFRPDQSSKQPFRPDQSSQQPFRTDQSSQQPFSADQSSQQPFRPDQSSQQPFRPGQSSQQPFRPDQSSQHPFRPDQSSQQPFLADQSSQQPFRPDQSSQQPFPADQSSQQPFRSDQSSQQLFRPDQSSQQPFRSDQSSKQPLRPNQNSQQPFSPSQSAHNLFLPDKPPIMASQSSQQPFRADQSYSQPFQPDLSSQKPFRGDRPCPQPLQSSQPSQQAFQVNQNSVSQSAQDYRGPFPPGPSITMNNAIVSQSFSQQNRTPNAQSYPETGAFIANQSSLPFSYGGRPTPSLLSQGSRPFPNNVTSSDYLTSYSVALAQTQLSQYQNTSSQQQQMQEFHSQLLLQQQQLILQQQEMLKQQQTQQHSHDSDQVQIGLLLQQILQQQKQLSDLESKLKGKNEHDPQTEPQDVSGNSHKTTVGEEKKADQSPEPDNKETGDKHQEDVLGGVNPNQNEKMTKEESKPPVSTTFLPDYEAAGKWFAACTDDNSQNDTKAAEKGNAEGSETGEQHKDTTETPVPNDSLGNLDGTEKEIRDIHPVAPDKECKDDLPVPDEIDSDNDIDILDEDEENSEANESCDNTQMEEARRREMEEQIRQIRELQNKPTISSSSNLPTISSSDLPNCTTPNNVSTIPPPSDFSTVPTHNNQPVVTGSNNIPNTSTPSNFYEPGQVPVSIPNKPGTNTDDEDNKPSLLRQCGHYYGSQISSIDQATNNSCLNNDECLQALISTVKGYDLVVKSLSAVKRGTNSDGFSMEWRELDRLQEYDSLSLTTHVASMNQPKNRYKDILPWDHSRVKLISKDDSDYINANIIKNITPLAPTFIAAQGPTATTLTDFWLMIWEQQSHLIVMLTREVEGNKLMCHQYWPIDEGHTILFGPIRVTLKTLVTNPLMVKRVMHVQHTDSQDTLVVTQLQFCGWPDKGVPQSPESLLAFVADTRSCYEQSLKESEERPVVVHCSAGIGRTGTFITIFSGMQEFDAHREFVNIPRLVRNLRLQRKYMVQKKEQYEFCYKTILFYARQFLDIVLSTLSHQKRASLDLSQLDSKALPRSVSAIESSHTPRAKSCEARFLGEVQSDDDLDDNATDNTASSQSISQKYCRGTLETDREDDSKTRKSAGENNVNTAKTNNISANNEVTSGKVSIGKDKEVRFTKDDDDDDEDEGIGAEDQQRKEQKLERDDELNDSQDKNTHFETKDGSCDSHDVSDQIDGKNLEVKDTSDGQTHCAMKEKFEAENISDEPANCVEKENSDEQTNYKTMDGKAKFDEQNICKTQKNSTDKKTSENWETEDNPKEERLSETKSTSEEPDKVEAKEISDAQSEPVEQNVDTTDITNDMTNDTTQDKSNDNQTDLSTDRTEARKDEKDSLNTVNKPDITDVDVDHINSSPQTENEEK